MYDYRYRYWRDIYSYYSYLISMFEYRKMVPMKREEIQTDKVMLSHTEQELNLFNTVYTTSKSLEKPRKEKDW